MLVYNEVSLEIDDEILVDIFSSLKFVIDVRDRKIKLEKGEYKKMAKVNGGQLVVKALEKEGVKYVFSISGGHISPIYDALLDSDIKLITTRHEQAAAMMAGGWARATGEVGVVIVTAGPGFTNAITGLADASMAGAPILCIAGTVAVDA